jgi:hypothetical protein
MTTDRGSLVAIYAALAALAVVFVTVAVATIAILLGGVLVNFKRIAEHINVGPLVRAIQAQPELWDQITGRQDHPDSPHQDTRTIYLRMCRELTPEAVFADLEAIDYPAMTAIPAARELAWRVGKYNHWASTYRQAGLSIRTRTREPTLTTTSDSTSCCRAIPGTPSIAEPRPST